MEHCETLVPTCMGKGEPRKVQRVLWRHRSPFYSSKYGYVGSNFVGKIIKKFMVKANYKLDMC